MVSWPWQGRRERGGYSADVRPLPERAEPPELFESLEQRQLLWVGPFFTSFPALTLLENNLDTVVRMQTTHGVVDIELFDAVAPQTVQNFKDYIARGAWDESFLHRSVAGFIVQGGGFKFTSAGGLSVIPTQPPIPNEFARSNVEGTIAMALLAGDPNSATSQFFFNTADNSASLDPQKFAVFGRVIQGWSVIKGINAMPKQNYSGSHPALTDVPVNQPGQPMSEANLVRIVDIEVIKPFGSFKYYEQAIYSPEGFRGPSIVERIDLLNLDPLQSFFQVIVRYETGERDSVILSGTLAGNQRLQLKLSDFNAPNLDLVRPGVGYAIEVRATRAIAGHLNHRDFGVTLGESMVMATRFTENALRYWQFAAGEKGPGFKSFVVLQNLTDQPATVHIGYYASISAAPKVVTIIIPPYRRGGLNVGIVGKFDNGPYSLRVVSSQPVMAMLSQYNFATGITDGALAGGVGLWRKEGFLPAAMVPSQGDAFLSALHHLAAPSVVKIDFDFILANGTVVAGKPLLLLVSQRRADYNLALTNPGLPKDQLFSIRYRATAAVSLQFTMETNGDSMSTPFTIASTKGLAFSDGFMDPTLPASQLREVVSLVNPHQSAASAYQVRYHFIDGTVITGASGSLAPLGRVDLDTRTLGGVMAKVQSAPAFRFYSISIQTAQTSGGSPVNGAALAQLTRHHVNWGQTMTTQAALDNRFPLFYMDHPLFK